MWIVKIALKRPYTFIVLALSDPAHQPAGDSAHAHRHFSERRHPGGCRAVELHRPERRGDGRAHRVPIRALAHHRGHRHRSHRIADRQRPQHHQGLLPSRYARRHGDGADDRRGADPRSSRCRPARTPPFMLVYSASSVPILQLALSGAGPFRAATVRLRRELHPHPTRDRARRGASRGPMAGSSAR